MAISCNDRCHYSPQNGLISVAIITEINSGQFVPLIIVTKKLLLKDSYRRVCDSRLPLWRNQVLTLHTVNTCKVISSVVYSKQKSVGVLTVHLCKTTPFSNTQSAISLSSLSVTTQGCQGSGPSPKLGLFQGYFLTVPNASSISWAVSTWVFL